MPALMRCIGSYRFKTNLPLPCIQSLPLPPYAVTSAQTLSAQTITSLPSPQ
jgi:hypothetical protein